MHFLNPITCPAYYSEHIAFSRVNTKTQILSRIVAVAAPIFYLYQMALHAALSAADLTLSIFLLTKGELCQKAMRSVKISAKCLLSSIFEIPEKLIMGPKNPPNYLGEHCRYKMNLHRWHIKPALV